MQALVYRAPWQVEVVDRPVPKLTRPTDCLVKVAACGICGTDVGIVRGQYPAVRPPVVLGHEAAGEVVEIGPAVRDLSVGDRVAINPTYFCGSCRMCRTGRTNHCLAKDGTEAGVSSDGALAEYYRTEERFLHPLPPQLSYEAGALIEPLSCVLTGVNKLAVRPGMNGVVLGLGPIGLMYALSLAARGLPGVAIEPAADRRALAEEVLAERGWTVRDTVAAVVEEYGGVGVDVLVDASGFVDEPTLRLMAPGGQVLLVALRPHQESIDLGLLADRSISLIGTIDSLGTFDDARDLLSTDRIPAKSLISRVVSLAEVPDSLALLGCDMRGRTYQPSAAALKVIVRICAG
jgi:threonine dehydrogenase-like Zn-dependent dehydrogenase